MLPLFMFTKAAKFTISTDKKRNRVCRICTFKMTSGTVVRWNPNRRFYFIKMTLKERILEFFKK
jgi:hypothetical protein